MPVKSQKQAGYFGRILSGQVKQKGITKAKAKEFLRGVSVKNLPKQAKKKKKTTWGK